MTYTLTMTFRSGPKTSTHETPEDAQTEAIWMNGHPTLGFIHMLTLSGPITTVSMVHPTRSDLHDIADHMESAEAWGWEA